MALNCECNNLVTLNKKLHAVVDFFEPHIIASSEVSHGALSGIHIGVKDMIAIAGVVRGNGNPNSKTTGQKESENAPVINLLLNAGAQICATTTLLEFAAGAQHPKIAETRNPQDLSRTAGGSSSGSAALVGAGGLRLTVGTDTGGSIRIPAAYCGCYGIMPSLNAIPTEGVTPLSPSFDHVGFLGDTLEILESALSVTVNNWQQQVDETFDEKALVIGVPRNWIMDSRNDVEIQKRFLKLEGDLLAAGHQFQDVDTALFEEVRSLFLPIILFEAWQVHADQMMKDPEFFGEETRRLLNLAKAITQHEYEKAQSALTTLNSLIDQSLEKFDLLIMPAVPYFAPETTPTLDSELGGYEGLYTEVFNATGHPALVSPCGSHSMKIGIQLIGKKGKEKKLIADAKLINPFLS